MADILNAVPPGPKAPDMVNVIIEISKNSRNKYEYDDKNQIIKLDRVIDLHLNYPANYGFIPQTLSRDGGNMDALVLTGEPLSPGVLVEARPIGLLRMIDKGKRDDKLLCVATCDPEFKNVKDIKDVHKQKLENIAYFFKVYKKAQKIKTRIEGWENANTARNMVKETIELYKKSRRR